MTPHILGACTLKWPMPETRLILQLNGMLLTETKLVLEVSGATVSRLRLFRLVTIMGREIPLEIVDKPARCTSRLVRITEKGRRVFKDASIKADALSAAMGRRAARLASERPRLVSRGMFDRDAE